MGYDPTPGQKSGNSTVSTGSSCSTQPPGDGTAKDPVGDGPNKALALEAIKYDSEASKLPNGSQKYYYDLSNGLGHGSTADLDKFANQGGGIDCSGFIRLVIWRAYGYDVGSILAQDFEAHPALFKKIPVSQAGNLLAGDIGVIEDGDSQHIDFITMSYGGGKLHQFGAHSASTDIHGGDTDTSHYTYYLRYIGKGSPGQ